GRVIVGGRDKAIHAIDAASGKSVWTFATRARVDSSPAVAGGRVYVGSSDGKLYVLDAATGKKQWEFDAGDAITASPAIAGGRLVSPVFGVVPGRGRRGGEACAAYRAGHDSPARPVPPHSVLPEAVPLLLLPCVHGQERAGSGPVSGRPRARVGTVRVASGCGRAAAQLRLLRRRHAVVPVD